MVSPQRPRRTAFLQIKSFLFRNRVSLQTSLAFLCGMISLHMIFLGEWSRPAKTSRHHDPNPPRRAQQMKINRIAGASQKGDAATQGNGKNKYIKSSVKKSEATKDRKDERKKDAAINDKKYERKKGAAIKNKKYERKKGAAIKDKKDERKKGAAIKDKKDEGKKGAATKDKKDEGKKGVVHVATKDKKDEKKKGAATKDKKGKRKKGAVSAVKMANYSGSTNPSLLPNATLSACLLIKDDNNLLNEWIAYHYFALNMRKLMVAIDPHSSETPSKILQRWRLMTDLEVFEWNDSDYMPREFLETGKPPDKFMLFANNFSFPGNITFPLTNENLLQISSHRFRQRIFLGKCMQSLRKKKASWMIHIDTDEFITSSKLLRQMRPKYVKIQPLDQPGSILNFLQQVVNQTANYVDYPCISMLRVLFGSVESDQQHIASDAPEGFDYSKFETLRWRYHGVPRDKTLNGNPKVILDLSAIPARYFEDVVFSIHRPVKEFCSKNSDISFNMYRKQALATNHYVGSWERYSSKQDDRRTRAVYDAKANLKNGRDDGLNLWLKGFVRLMGSKMAGELLGNGYLLPVTRNKSLTAVS